MQKKKTVFAGLAAGLGIALALAAAAGTRTPAAADPHGDTVFVAETSYDGNAITIKADDLGTVGGVARTRLHAHVHMTPPDGTRPIDLVMTFKASGANADQVAGAGLAILIARLDGISDVNISEALGSAGIQVHFDAANPNPVAGEGLPTGQRIAGQLAALVRVSQDVTGVSKISLGTFEATLGAFGFEGSCQFDPPNPI